jgi:CspA family cold shock protein
MNTGIITGLQTDKGFGFIKVDGSADGQKDLFFHVKELRDGRIEDLQIGDKLQFEIGDSPKGQNAINVSKA